MKNKLLIIVLIITICLGILMPLYADQKQNSELNPDKPASLISKEKAERIAKNFFVIPKGYQKMPVKFVGPPGPQGWSFEWTKDKEANFWISIVIDPNSGEVNRFYNRSHTLWQLSDFNKPSISAVEAHSKALTYLEKFSPSKKPYLQEAQYLTIENGDKTRRAKKYVFRFKRMVNKAWFDGEGIDITITEKGKLENYFCIWSKVPANLPKSNISDAEAKKIFADKWGVHLTYTLAGEDLQGKPMLVYLITQEVFLDAETGKIIDGYGKAVSDEYLTALKAMPSSKVGGIFNIGKSKITKEEAQKIIAIRVGVPSGYDFKGVRLDTKIASGRKLWRISYISKSTTKDVYVLNGFVAVDNGEIIRVENYNTNLQRKPLSKDTKILSYSEGRKIAQDFITKIAPEKAKYLCLDASRMMLQSKEDILKISNFQDYEYNFTRFINGIGVLREGVKIYVDAETGEVTFYRDNMTRGDIFPKPKNILPVDTIIQKVFSNKSLELKYSIDYLTKKASLGYGIDPYTSSGIDAQTGKPFKIQPLD